MGSRAIPGPSRLPVGGPQLGYPHFGYILPPLVGCRIGREPPASLQWLADVRAAYKTAAVDSRVGLAGYVVVNNPGDHAESPGR